MIRVPHPPVISDCRSAFSRLPSGTAPTRWYTKSAAGEERNVLPIHVSHGKQPFVCSEKSKFAEFTNNSGECEIIFHLSGQSAEEVDSIEITPTDVKTMAIWVLGRCSRLGKGGMVTKGLAKTINSMNDARSKVFPDPALRKMIVIQSHSLCC